MMVEWLGGLMFVVLLGLLFSGYPVAFGLGGTALYFAVVGVAAGYFDWALLMALPERILGIMSNYVLLAVPFFIFMGTLLEKSRLASDLLTTVGKLFGPLPGGLALAVVLVGTLLAAATGVIGASVIAMGLISLPVMLRYGYSKPFSAGVILSSATLGQIIPPSVVLVVLADQIGVSVGDLFKGAIVPGLMLSGLFFLYVLAVVVFKPSAAPALPPEARGERGWVLARHVLKALVPPLVLVVVVLGSIFQGIATPTEAGALGAVGALLLALFNRRLTWRVLRETMENTAQLTAMVIFLLVASNAFTLVFRGLYGDVWLAHMLTNLPGGKIGLLVLANLAIFALGFFIDFFEIVFIVVPLLLPAFQAFGVDMVWLGVMIGVNLQTSFLTPPFGFALFYLRGIAPPDLATADIYRGVVPFIIIQLVAVLLVVLFPGLVTGLL